MPYRCCDCRKRFSVRTRDGHGGLQTSASQTRAIATYLATTSLKGVSSMKLHRDLGITQKSAWHLSHRIREAWQHNGPPTFRRPRRGRRDLHRRQGAQQAQEQEAARWPRHGRQDRRGRHQGPRERAGLGGRRDVHRRPHVQAIRALTDRAGGRRVHYEHGSYRGLASHRTVRHSVGEYVNGQAHTKVTSRKLVSQCTILINC